MPRKGRLLPRGELHLAELKARTRTTSRLMNVKIPAYIADAIRNLAAKLDASKTEVVVALLNEGLAVAQKKRAG